jgi:hypothetical protein
VNFKQDSCQNSFFFQVLLCYGNWEHTESETDSLNSNFHITEGTVLTIKCQLSFSDRIVNDFFFVFVGFF